MIAQNDVFIDNDCLFSNTESQAIYDYMFIIFLVKTPLQFTMIAVIICDKVWSFVLSDIAFFKYNFCSYK
jgi:hypothetical protein